MGQEALVSSASAEAKRVCDEGEECSPFSSANSFSLKGAASKLIKAGREPWPAQSQGLVSQGWVPF